MKKWELIFTETEDGEINIASCNQGYNAMELIALLELKKADILAQTSPETTFKRTLIDDNGNKYDLKEEK